VDYIPVMLNSKTLATLDLDSVCIQDLRKLNPSANVRYYKNLIPELLLKSCQNCGKFFTLDEYEFEYIQHKHCPFCNK
jgi:intraflagellar transport protein 122